MPQFCIYILSCELSITPANVLLSPAHLTLKQIPITERQKTFLAYVGHSDLVHLGIFDDTDTHLVMSYGLSLIHT